ncbi:MAG: VCBS repeat-containing protein [Planctomycetes bacterium]|nr:VCBS repeat-containing protein [Planctomycetota bacterium]
MDGLRSRVLAADRGAWVVAWLALGATACGPPSGIADYEGPEPFYEVHRPLSGRGCVGIASRFADVTGDRRPELLVFATSLDPGGDPTALAELHDATTGAVVARFTSPRPGKLQDCSANFVGDLDGDRREDVALIVDSAGGPRKSGDGVCVFSSRGGLLFELKPESVGARFASTAAAAGDVDGDGSNDVALVERRARGVPSSWSNDVVFVSGRDGRRIDLRLPVGGLDVEIDELLSLDDVDGDGGIELAVRVRAVIPTAAYLETGADASPEVAAAVERARQVPPLCVVSCSPPRVVWVLPAEPAAALESGALGRTSDFDGDGIADLLLRTAYGGRVVSARTGEALERLDVGGDRTVLGEVGDWDGDGVAELLVQNNAMRSVGWDRTLYVWFQVVSRRGSTLLGEVGLGVPFVDAAVCEDLDGDGLADFVVESGRSVRAFSRRDFVRP